MKFTVLLLFALTCAISAQETDSIIINADQYDYQTGDHELFFMPTAHTMPERQSYLGWYELFLFNYTLAAGPSTHIGVYVMPIPSFQKWIETVSITLLVKHNYYDTRAFSSAAYGMISVNGYFIALGNSFSYEMDGIGFHGGIGSAIVLHNSKTYGLFLLGSKAKIFDSLYGIAEYSNTSGEMLNMDEKFTGMVTAGLRYRDRYCGLEAAVSKPFGNNSVDLFPVIKFIAYF